MFEKKEAYGILGLREDAGRDEVEKRFAVLLKKHKASLHENPGQASQVNIEEIARAYNILMGYEEIKPEESGSKAPNPILEKFGLDEKKVGNFLHYHKMHIIIGIVALIVLIVTLRGCLFKVKPDLNIAFIGEFFYTDSEQLRQAIKSRLTDLKDVSVDGAILSDKIEGQQGYVMQMKAVTLFAAGDVDVYILDSINFEQYARMGAFISLDNAVDDLHISRMDSRGITLKIEDEEKEYLYGIDVSDSPIFKEGGIPGEKKIAAIGIKAKYYENAIRLIKLLLE